ncbi:Helix-turn-helix domain protein [Actinomadura rubteroloni]|uniref:Helix-turn-helix domain protein n=1 Tax=Actinomadura rubteroloni TaxID=1926885 RepID=A0A2P4URW4_9ACTN|nr:Helix-turn-helix domain protein [Actinomadura rubteroloni]
MPVHVPSSATAHDEQPRKFHRPNNTAPVIGPSNTGVQKLNEKNEQQPTLYTPSEVAQFFRVDPKTVTRWAKTGTLHPITLPSGHRRYHATEIHNLLQLGNAHDTTAGGPDTSTPAKVSDPIPSGRARAVLHSVVRDYFNGDKHAAINILNAD